MQCDILKFQGKHCYSIGNSEFSIGIIWILFLLQILHGKELLYEERKIHVLFRYPAPQ